MLPLTQLWAARIGPTEFTARSPPYLEQFPTETPEGPTDTGTLGDLPRILEINLHLPQLSQHLRLSTHSRREVRAGLGPHRDKTICL